MTAEKADLLKLIGQKREKIYENDEGIGKLENEIERHTQNAEYLTGEALENCFKKIEACREECEKLRLENDQLIDEIEELGQFLKRYPLNQEMA